MPEKHVSKVDNQTTAGFVRTKYRAASRRSRAASTLSRISRGAAIGAADLRAQVTPSLEKPSPESFAPSVPPLTARHIVSATQKKNCKSSLEMPPPPYNSPVIDDLVALPLGEVLHFVAHRGEDMSPAIRRSRSRADRGAHVLARLGLDTPANSRALLAHPPTLPPSLRPPSLPQPSRASTRSRACARRPRPRPPARPPAHRPPATLSCLVTERCKFITTRSSGCSLVPVSHSTSSGSSSSTNYCGSSTTGGRRQPSRPH